MFLSSQSAQPYLLLQTAHLAKSHLTRARHKIYRNHLKKKTHIDQPIGTFSYNIFCLEVVKHMLDCCIIQKWICEPVQCTTSLFIQSSAMFHKHTASTHKHSPTLRARQNERRLWMDSEEESRTSNQ